MSLASQVNLLAARIGAMMACERVDFSLVGSVTAGSGTLYVPIHGGTFTIKSIAARLRVAGTGTTTILDVKKNGTTIFGTAGNRPTFAISGQLATTGAWSTTTVTTGDYLSIDVVQAGTGATDLTLGVRLLRTA